MIVEFFIDIGFGFLDRVFSLLPKIEWTVNTSAWTYAKDILDMICYLLPINTITAIGVLIIDIALLRVAISFIRTVLGLIPFV